MGIINLIDGVNKNMVKNSSNGPEVGIIRKTK